MILEFAGEAGHTTAADGWVPSRVRVCVRLAFGLLSVSCRRCCQRLAFALSAVASEQCACHAMPIDAIAVSSTSDVQRAELLLPLPKFCVCAKQCTVKRLN